MKFIYIITQDGKELLRGSAIRCADRLGVTDRDVYSMSKATEMGITVIRKEIPVSKEKKETMADRLRTVFKIYNNTVLGDEPENEVSKALRQLKKEGIAISAEYRRDHWYLERKNS